MNHRRSLKLWQARSAYRHKKHRWYHTRSKRPDRQLLARKWHKLAEQADAMVARRKRQIAEAKPLRLRALAKARQEVGVMESGGNNRGLPHTRYSQPNGAAGPEPWCGNFMAWCYRQAGSKTVTRPWAAVRYLGHITGQKIVRDPLPGDLVCFTFDHVGMYVRSEGSNIITIEGNTGSSGARSDSSTGGDGVYIKTRPKSQVARYVRVLR